MVELLHENMLSNDDFARWTTNVIVGTVFLISALYMLLGVFVGFSSRGPSLYERAKHSISADELYQRLTEDWTYQYWYHEDDWDQLYDAIEEHDRRKFYQLFCLLYIRHRHVRLTEGLAELAMARLVELFQTFFIFLTFMTEGERVVEIIMHAESDAESGTQDKTKRERGMTQTVSTCIYFRRSTNGCLLGHVARIGLRPQCVCELIQH